VVQPFNGLLHASQLPVQAGSQLPLTQLVALAFVVPQTLSQLPQS
jgi:hypothetical protein